MLIQANKSCLLIIDMQEKIAPAMHNGDKVVERARWLVEVANEIGVKTLASEQYPQGLGRTVETLLEVVSEAAIMPKDSFSCMNDLNTSMRINTMRPAQVIIAGFEAHNSVLQTAIQLLQQAREVYVVADAVSSSNEMDKDFAIERLRQAGAFIVTSEMVAYEWLQRADHDAFKRILKTHIKK